MAGGPIEFGMAEFQRAVASRGLKPIALATEVTGGPAESYRVRPGKVTGGDARGVMYGLLEAAEQIRRAGRIVPAEGRPSVRLRGIRMFLHNADLERDWYYSREYWDEFFALLARSRFNRFNLVFAHQTNYLAPPYPFWLDLPEFPGIRPKAVSAAERRRNLEMLQYISNAAAAHGVDFTLGIWQHDVQKPPRPPQEPTVDGITLENVGPYSYAALKKILALCPAVHSVQLRTNVESGIPDHQQVEFYRDWVFRAVRETERRVYLDVRGWIMHPDLFRAVRESKLPVRLSTKYWAEDMGRPYQPLETFPRYSYMHFLENARPYEFYWEIWALGSHRLLLWGDPEYVRRAAGTFSLGDGIGFEIDAPLAQKGYGNRPGKWGIFAAGQQDKTFWKHEFERYWMFYLLWGRLTYDPAAPDSIWMDELRRRFGPAAEDVGRAYRHASAVLSEIVAAHMADPNMYIWPEINPGGLIGAYKDVLPSDWRLIARMREAVRNRLDGVASAKQTPLETAEILDRAAAGIEQAVASAARKIARGHAEWKSSESDFRVLAGLARYHARKQRAAYALTWFYETGDPASLSEARKHARVCLEIWRGLVRLTDGVYPSQMAYGPNDVGHWKDKLPFVQHDVDWLDELAANFERFGRADHRFDFGGAPATAPDVPYRTYRDGQFIRYNNVEPRFVPIHPKTGYSDRAGFGWVGEGQRSAMAMEPTPYLEVAAVSSPPKRLPRNVLLGDWIEGEGAQVFRVRTGEGFFEARLVKPDGSSITRQARAERGVLDVVFPEGRWQVSGLLVSRKDALPPPAKAMPAVPKRLPRPRIDHTPVERADAQRPLTLSVKAEPASAVKGIRLHYRAVNQELKFRTLEANGAAAEFTVPGKDIDGRWDLLYYFEVLNAQGTGWFHPDPAVRTPYFVVKVGRP